MEPPCPLTRGGQPTAALRVWAVLHSLTIIVRSAGVFLHSARAKHESIYVAPESDTFVLLLREARDKKMIP